MTSPILAVANQKGGVGKTTVTLGLAAAVAQTGQRVLVIDMDSQANASMTLLPDYDTRKDAEDFFTTVDVLGDDAVPEELGDAIVATPWDRVDLIGSHIALASVESSGKPAIETRLRKMLRGLRTLPPERVYDLVLLDCPPSVGKLTLNSFLAATHALLVTGPDRYGLNALNEIARTLRIVREDYESDIEVSGIVVNRYTNTKESLLRTEQLRDQYGEGVLEVFPQRTVLAEANAQNESIFALNRPEARSVAEQFAHLAQVLGFSGNPSRVPGRSEPDTGEEPVGAQVPEMAAGSY